MLQALTRFGEPILAWHATKGEDYLCPECNEKLILKQGQIVTEHFAHYPGVHCPSAGEGLRHMEMKRQIGALFEHCGCQYEISLIPNHRADVLIAGGIVVECQDSPMSVDEWSERTCAYTVASYPVLWVWNIDRIALDPKSGNERSWSEFSFFADEERRIPAEIRQCHYMSYGRVYALDYDGVLAAIHFNRAARRETEWYNSYGESGYSVYTPRTLRSVEIHIPPSIPFPLRTKTGLYLVELGDGVWWKPLRTDNSSQSEW